MARISKTSRKIALTMAAQFVTCAVNYEPIGARMVDDCAKALDLDFRGVWEEYTELTESTRNNYPEALYIRSAARL